MLAQQARLHKLDQTPDFIRALAIQKLQLEAQAAFEEINKQSSVTPEEINQYYTAHSADYDEMTVRQFVVRVKPPGPPASQANLTAPAQGLTAEEAKARAEAIRKELAAGTDIKKVVEDFKKPGEVDIDPEPRKFRRIGLPPNLEKVVFALKDGEVSEPVEVPQAIVFFQATGHSHVDIKEVSPDIEKKVQREKVDAAMAEVKKNSNVWMDDQYFAGPPKPPAGPPAGPTLGAPSLKTPPKP